MTDRVMPFQPRLIVWSDGDTTVAEPDEYERPVYPGNIFDPGSWSVPL